MRWGGRRTSRRPTSRSSFRTTLAYQAHHLDTDFYDRFYEADALSATQRGRQPVVDALRER